MPKPGSIDKELSALGAREPRSGPAVEGRLEGLPRDQLRRRVRQHRRQRNGLSG